MLGFSPSFDAVNHKILEKCGIRRVAETLIMSYLINRKQIVCGGGFSSSLLNINVGVPQGSVLGPILFFIKIT